MTKATNAAAAVHAPSLQRFTLEDLAPFTKEGTFLNAPGTIAAGHPAPCAPAGTIAPATSCRDDDSVAQSASTASHVRCTSAARSARNADPSRGSPVESSGAGSRAMDNAASDGAGGQLVGNAGWPIGGTGRAHVGVAHDLPTVALENASRCPPPLGQPAPARRAPLSSRVRARVAHIAHSPHHDRILDFSEKAPYSSRSCCTRAPSSAGDPQLWT